MKRYSKTLSDWCLEFHKGAVKAGKDNETLNDFNREAVKAEKDKMRQVIRQVAEGLKHVHEYGYIHLDLKPENILINDFGETVQIGLADFGSARETSDPHEALKCDTIDLGTCPYNTSGDRYYTTGIDMWSVGLVLYNMLEMRSNGCTVSKYDLKKAYRDGTLHSETHQQNRLKDIEEEFRDIILDCLKPYDQRVSAKSLADKLGDIPTIF